jgi:hypothetical protein
VATGDLWVRAKGLYDQLFPVDSPRRKSGPWVVGGLLLVILLLGKCAVSSVNDKVSALSAARAEETRVRTTGVLVVTSNRPEATVEATPVAAAGAPAADSVKGAPGQALSNLKPGKYAVTLRAEGWPDARGEVDVPPGRQTDVTVNFKGGSLRLETDPAGATVKLGGALLGKTPLVIPLLPPGEVLLSLEYPAWPAMPYKAAITEGQEAAARVRLPHGKLTVESFPTGATVLLGRQTLGKTPLTVDRLPVGAKKLVLQMKDFPPLEVAFTVVDGETANLRPVLGLAFPVLDPAELLRAVWVPDDSRTARAFAGIYRPKNDVVKNIHRELFYNRWQNKIYRYAGVVKSQDASGRVEFAEEKSELSRYRVIAQLKSTPAAGATSAKGSTRTLYGRLTAAEEPTLLGRVITLELSDAEFLPEGTP